MNPMEIVSLVIVIMVLLKFLIFLIRPTCLEKMAKAMVKRIALLRGGIAIGLLVLGYFVFTNLTIIQALPAILLGHLILAIVLVREPKMYDTLVKTVMKDRTKLMCVWIIWVALSLWTLYVLFI